MNDKQAKAIEKLQSDLTWRGPNGREMGYVVIPRDLAQELLSWIHDQVHQAIEGVKRPDEK